jgi:hypothetical protein
VPERPLGDLTLTAPETVVFRHDIDGAGMRDIRGGFGRTY